jgi:hypothetical protein
MGDAQRANQYIGTIQTRYVNNNFPWPWYSAEAGWFIRVNALMETGAGVTVTVSSPTNGATVSSPVTFNASATSSHTITGWHIYVDSVDSFSAGQVNSISPSLSLSTGQHTVVIRAWDSTGAFGDGTLTITIQ